MKKATREIIFVRKNRPSIEEINEIILLLKKIRNNNVSTGYKKRFGISEISIRWSQT